MLPVFFKGRYSNIQSNGENCLTIRTVCKSPVKLATYPVYFIGDTMSNTFLNSMSNSAQTANGGATNTSSLNNCVDLFFQIGSMRSNSEEDSLVAWTKAFLENPQTALKILFWARDVRHGAGERRVFRTILTHLAERNPELFSQQLISQIPEFGRWDDLFVFFGTKLEGRASNVIENALQCGDALCAKWMPREKGSKSHIARALRRHMGMTPRAYRKTLSNLTSVVETQMCNSEWSDINYSHVPSQAMRIYKNAFQRNAPETWAGYLSQIASGEAKVNAGAIHPHQILGPYIRCSNNSVGYGYGSTTYTTHIEPVPRLLKSSGMHCPTGWIQTREASCLLLTLQGL